MSKRKGGYRRRTRKLWSKHWRDKGKISLTKYFAVYAPGQVVTLCAEPAVQKGLYHSRFHGLTGEVIRKRGDCYELQIYDGNKPKLLIVHPIHLKALHSMKAPMKSKAEQTKIGSTSKSRVKAKKSESKVLKTVKTKGA